MSVMARAADALLLPDRKGCDNMRMVSVLGAHPNFMKIAAVKREFKL